MNKTTILQVRFLVHFWSLQSLHAQEVKFPYGTIYEGRKHTMTTFSSLSNLVCDPQEFKSMKNRLHLPFQGSWSKRDKICFPLRHQNALTERPGKTPYRDKAIGDYTGHSHIILQAANSERLIYLQTY